MAVVDGGSSGVAVTPGGIVIIGEGGTKIIEYILTAIT